MYGQPGPPIVVDVIPCGQLYQDGLGVSTGPAACACGTFAVGACRSCERTVCGGCSAVVDGQRTCVSCRQEAAALTAAAEAAETARIVEETRRRQRKIAEDLAEALSEHKGCALRLLERLVAAGCPGAHKVPADPAKPGRWASKCRAWTVRESRYIPSSDSDYLGRQTTGQVITEHGQLRGEAPGGEYEWFAWQRAAEVLAAVCRRHGIDPT
jgi:hypothetical protein